MPLWIRWCILVSLAMAGNRTAPAKTYSAKPASAAGMLSRLRPGDTLELAPGAYAHLSITGLRGEANNWITVTGPESGAPAVIAGNDCCNTVEILNSSFLAIKNLTIDSKGIDGAFGISAKDGLRNQTHDILIENCLFIGQGASQQTVGISTKTPTWGWILRGNRIEGAGTGMYLGNSDGTMPFIGGLIENNLIENTTGYNIEIKWQQARPAVPGLPSESRTVLRNNVFLKDDRPNPDGDRPTVLVGGFPASGPGSTDLYEIYGNFFSHNPREVLLQASGRVSVHDNVFVGGDGAAMALQAQDLPLRFAHVYNNTVYATQTGILFGSPALEEDAVVGNLVFAASPISGPVKHAPGNITGNLAAARSYVNAPSFDIAAMDFYPLPGKCRGEPLDLSRFGSDPDWRMDFNGAPKTGSGGAVVFRGAYAGEGPNPGWKFQAALKKSAPAVPSPPRAQQAAAGAVRAFEISSSSARRGASGSFLIRWNRPPAAAITAVQWELSAGPGITIAPADIAAGSAAESAQKSLACAPRQTRYVCILAGGQKVLESGTLAVVRYQVSRSAPSGNTAVRIAGAAGTTADGKAIPLAEAEGAIAVQ